MIASLAVFAGFLLYAAGAYFAMQAIIVTRSPQGAVAWALGILTLPFIFLPAYLLFGRQRLDDYIDARSQSEACVRSSLDADQIHPQEINLSDQDVHPGMVLGSRLLEAPVSNANAVKLLIDGEAKFNALLQALKESRRYVLVQYYTLSGDDIGERLRKALYAAAQRGVKIYIIYDELGSISTPSEFFEEMTEHGIQVVPFKSYLTRRRRFQLNFRNHRKIVVIDGQEAFVGGLNVGDAYIDGGSQFENWRDTHLSIRGPAVSGAQLSFMEDWHWSTEQKLELDWDFEATSKPGQRVAILPVGPSEGYETCTLLYAGLINSAVERIWLASPYLVPPVGIMLALKLAAKRGLDVRILLPAKSDGVLVNLAGAVYRQELDDSGVKVFCYTNGFMHQKVLLVDNAIAGVGSINLDQRSFHLNFEVLCLVDDEPFAREVEQMLESDLEHCTPYQSGSLAEKSFWQRLASHCAYLASPLL